MRLRTLAVTPAFRRVEMARVRQVVYETPTGSFGQVCRSHARQGKRNESPGAPAPGPGFAVAEGEEDGARMLEVAVPAMLRRPLTLV
ncbi:hypothetical protein SCA03_16090 [Streptomyces cacaoi]|uniref:Uncharacterized protein n=1 Tax=Streptomyces cacaoi TaxID=1898 RepID=A0A4Y3QXA3_STRCI|nr:hypothetical protein SCA03_16090 [Streptomyces cacaoi]